MFRYALALTLITTSTHAWEATGFEMPESVLPNTAQNQLFVSNIVGNPGEADGNGYISRLGLDGTILDQKWATGLDAPKGMALFQGNLIVADLTKLRVIDGTSGEVIQTLNAKGAQFLNDVTASDDRVWISDMFTGVIWSFNGNDLSPWFADPVQPHPNGLWTDGETLVVGNWGTGMKPDFSTATPGDLVAIDIASKEQTVLVPKLSNLDGVAKTSRGFVTNDWITGAVYHVIDGTAEKIIDAPVGTADLAVADGVLYLPHMLDGRITTQAID